MRLFTYLVRCCLCFGYFCFYSCLKKSCEETPSESLSCPVSFRLCPSMACLVQAVYVSLEFQGHSRDIYWVLRRKKKNSVTQCALTVLVLNIPCKRDLGKFSLVITCVQIYTWDDGCDLVFQGPKIESDAKTKTKNSNTKTLTASHFEVQSAEHTSCLFLLMLILMGSKLV